MIGIREGNIFGYLLEKGYEPLLDEKSFFGVGFNKNGVPLDVAGMHLLGNLSDDFSFLMTDTFPSMNGADPADTVLGLQHMRRALKGLNGLYGSVPLLHCSDFFDSPSLRQIFEQVRNRVMTDKCLYPISNGKGYIVATDLQSATRETIPKHLRSKDGAINYPINEYACVGFLNNQGFRVKTGQDREKLYDRVMQHLFPEMSFVHAKKVYDLSPTPKEVTQYAAKPDETRIFLDDPEDEAIRKMGSASPQVLKYLATIGAIAGNISGRPYTNLKSVVGMQGIERLRDAAARMLVENILLPYQRAMS